MQKTELLETLKNHNFLIEETADFINIRVSNEITKNDLLEGLKVLLEYEAEHQEESSRFNLLLKGSSVENLAEAFKFALSFESLVDPVMLLNIINLVKVYNTLHDDFFNDEFIYVSSIEDLLDLKLAISDEIKAFIKRLSIYFISLFKSYNKITYTPLDVHIALPNIYHHLFVTLDLLTLSGIFARAESFETKECVYIENGAVYVNEMLTKSSIGTVLMDMFFKGLENGSSEG